MTRTVHRIFIIPAALALASWALVAGAPVLAATTAEQAGPSLPPAEYKPLPVGTRVTYDTWGYTVTKTEGFDITFKTTAGNRKHYYAVFGKQGDAAYTPRGDNWRTTLDDETRAALERLWPLKVGKKAKWNLKESYIGHTTGSTISYALFGQPWTVTVEVVGTEVLELNGFLYPTYVVKEHAVGGTGNPMEYTETKWYNPESGLVLKSVKEWTRELGDEEEYTLVKVKFPQGTKTHVLAATEIRPPPLASAPTPAPALAPAPAVPTSTGTPRKLSGAEIQRLSASGASVLSDTVIVDSKATGGFGFHPEEPPPAGGTPMVSGFVFEAPSTVVITATGRIDLYPDVLELEGISPAGYEVWGSLWDLGRSQIGYTPLEEASVDGGADFNSFPDAMLHTGALMGAFVPNSTVASPGFSPKNEDLGVPGIGSDQLFLIGSGPFEFMATEPGTLFLGVNDGRASNNTGSFKVKVRFPK